MKYICYKEDYKYQLNNDYTDTIKIKPNASIKTDYIDLSSDGDLLIKKGYAWDGPSGPTLDTLTFMRGSLVHDALYQLMRNGELDRDIYRSQADKLLQQMCKDDGMWRFRAWYVHFVVSNLAESATHLSNKKDIIKAPKGDNNKCC